MSVLPHGPLVRIRDDLWVLTGALPNMALPRNMVVWRAPGGALWLHSVIAVDEATLTALEALGTPTWMVVPSGLHRLDAPWYKQRFPSLRVLAPEASRAQVAQKVPVDATCEAELPSLGIGCLTPGGLRPSELVYRLPLADGGCALVFNDALFHLIEPVRGFGGFVLKALGSHGFFGITRIGRLSLLRQRAGFSAFLRELAADPDVRVICVSHGATITDHPSQKLEAAAALV